MDYREYMEMRKNYLSRRKAFDRENLSFTKSLEAYREVTERKIESFVKVPKGFQLTFEWSDEWNETDFPDTLCVEEGEFDYYSNFQIDRYWHIPFYQLDNLTQESFDKYEQKGDPLI